MSFFINNKKQQSLIYSMKTLKTYKQLNETNEITDEEKSQMFLDHKLSSYVANCKSVSEIRSILEDGANPNFIRIRGNSLLMVMIRRNCKNIIDYIKLFIEFGVNLNHRNDKGETAIYIAAYESNYEIVELLIVSGADLKIQYSNNHIRKETYYIFDFLKFRGDQDFYEKLVEKYPEQLQFYLSIKKADEFNL